MFDSETFHEGEANRSSVEVTNKRLKLSSDLDYVHPSLVYTSFKAPPLVEYNSIDTYSEKNTGKSLIPSHEATSQSFIGINMIKSISSPIVLKSPNQKATRRTMTNSNHPPPHILYSVEELSLVKSLEHWTNTKVCPVGRIQADVKSNQYSLQSVLENGVWQVLLDISTLNEAPKTDSVVQIFGNVEVIADKPIIKVNFYRNLPFTDIKLFVASYKRTQEQISDVYDLPKRNDLNKLEFNGDTSIGQPLNDTLDDYNFSVVEPDSTIDL